MLTRLSEQFNVNHFIVSQVNPHVVPFIMPTTQKYPGADMEQLTSDGSFGAAYGLPATLSPLSRLINYLGGELKNLLINLAELGLLPLHISMKYILEQTYTGDITIVPSVKMSDYLSLLHNPSFEQLQNCIDVSERSTWELLAMIKSSCEVEFTLDECVKRMRKAMAIQMKKQLETAKLRSGLAAVLRNYGASSSWTPDAFNDVRQAMDEDSSSAHATDDDETEGEDGEEANQEEGKSLSVASARVSRSGRRLSALGRIMSRAGLAGLDKLPTSATAAATTSSSSSATSTTSTPQQQRLSPSSRSNLSSDLDVETAELPPFRVTEPRSISSKQLRDEIRCAEGSAELLDDDEDEETADESLRTPRRQPVSTSTASEHSAVSSTPHSHDPDSVALIATRGGSISADGRATATVNVSDASQPARPSRLSRERAQSGTAAAAGATTIATAATGAAATAEAATATAAVAVLHRPPVVIPRMESVDSAETQRLRDECKAGLSLTITGADDGVARQVGLKRSKSVLDSPSKYHEGGMARSRSNLNMADDVE